MQPPEGVLQTTFSQRGIQERGDTRGWTETPQQKLLRLSAGEAASARAIESAPAPSAAAGAVDAYNQAHRPKTLMEQHKERLKVSPNAYVIGPGSLLREAVWLPVCRALYCQSLCTYSRMLTYTMLQLKSLYTSQEEKKKKKEKKRKIEDQGREKSEGDKDTWDPKVHPWRPFDREKDLNIGPKVVTKEELMKKAGTLDMRFAGTPSGQRSFL